MPRRTCRAALSCFLLTAMSARASLYCHTWPSEQPVRCTTGHPEVSLDPMSSVSQTQSEVAATAPARGARRAAAGRRLTGYALVLPAFLVVFAMLIYPLLYDAVESFIGAEGFNTGGPFVGLANYARAFSD